MFRPSVVDDRQTASFPSGCLHPRSSTSPLPTGPYRDGAAGRVDRCATALWPRGLVAAPNHLPAFAPVLLELYDVLTTVDIEPPSRTELRKTVVFFVALTVLAGVVFWPSMQQWFILDDFGYLNVVQQPGWWHSTPAWDVGAQVFRPVMVLTVGIQNAAFGLDPFPYHLVALALLVVQGVLIHQIALRLGLGSFGAKATAAALVLHPTNGYTLMWMACMSSYWATMFALGVILLFTVAQPSRRATVAALGLFVLALMSREISMVIPAIVTAMWLFRSKGPWRDRGFAALRRAGPLWAILAVYLAARVTGSLYHQAQPERPRLVPILNLSSFTKALPDSPIHLRDLFVLGSFPFRFRLLESGLSFPSWGVAAALVFWVVLIVAVVFAVRAGRWVPAFGLAWFAICLVPPAFLQAEITYPNYTDLGNPGLCLAIGALIEPLVRTWSPVRRSAGACVGVGLLVWVGFNGGNTLIKPPPQVVTRPIELRDQVLAAYPDPPAGSTIVVTGARPEDWLWTANGDLFRVLYGDPTLEVQFEAAGRVEAAP